MPETTHSPLPWRCRRGDEPESEWFLVEDADGVEIASLYADRPEVEADARRIVACVNACATLPDDTLAPGTVSDLVCRVVQFNDALLAACEAALPRLEAEDADFGGEHPTTATVRDAITLTKRNRR